MTKRSKKTPARKLYRVVFSGANRSNDVPGTFKTRADGLKALRAVKTQQEIENLAAIAFRSFVSTLRESR